MCVPASFAQEANVRFCPLAMYGSLARILEAWLRVVRDSAPEAVETMQEHADQRLRMGTAFGQTFHDMLIADARLRLGEVEAAMAAAREGLTRARDHDRT